MCEAISKRFKILKSMPKNQNVLLFSGLVFLLIVVFLLNITFGQVAIPFKEVFQSLSGNVASKSTWEYIIIHFRLPKAIVAILVGIGISVAGLMMQTLFKNSLADPYILGLSSGSSLGVSVLILGASLLSNPLGYLIISTFGIISASCIGSFLVFSFVIIAAKKVKDTNTILIIGLIFSSFVASFVSILTNFSGAIELQKFAFWSLGNLGNLDWKSILILGLCILVGLVLALQNIKSLDGLLLGENYAKSMGQNISKTRLSILFATSLITGSITAFVGPIAFVGLAVPHLAKILFKTSKHLVLLAATCLCGAILMLLCDTISQMPGFEFTLPINAVTSIIGAPIIIILLLKKQTSN